MSSITSWSLPQFMDEGLFPAPEPIVEGLLHRGELMILSATAKTGKSLLVTNLALSVGYSEPFLDTFKTQSVNVLVLQTEITNHAFRERLEKMLKARPFVPTIHISSVRFRLDDDQGLLTLHKKIKDLDIGLLVLDPFYTMHAKDEDKAKEMAPLLSSLKSLVLTCNIACVLVHHQGKRGEGDPRQPGHQHRGSSAFADVPDGSWSFNKVSEPKGAAKLTFELRNGSAPDSVMLRLGSDLWWVPMGADELPMDTTSPTGVATILAEAGPTEREELLRSVEAEYRCKRRKAESLLTEAVQCGYVQKETVGRKVIYSISSQPPHRRKPLEECAPAVIDDAVPADLDGGRE